MITTTGRRENAGRGATITARLAYYGEGKREERIWEGRVGEEGWEDGGNEVRGTTLGYTNGTDGTVLGEDVTVGAIVVKASSGRRWDEQRGHGWRGRKVKAWRYLSRAGQTKKVKKPPPVCWGLESSVIMLLLQTRTRRRHLVSTPLLPSKLMQDGMLMLREAFPGRCQHPSKIISMPRR